MVHAIVLEHNLSSPDRSSSTRLGRTKGGYDHAFGHQRVEEIGDECHIQVVNERVLATNQHRTVRTVDHELLFGCGRVQ